MIINIGVAGTLTKDLSVLDVALASDVFQHDMDTSALGDPKGLISGINIITLPCVCPELEGVEKLDIEEGVKLWHGKIASGDKFISDKGEKEKLAREFDAAICEMEGAAIAQVCYAANIPCTILRTVSDTLSGGDVDFEKFKVYAAEISNSVLRKMLS